MRVSDALNFEMQLEYGDNYVEFDSGRTVDTVHLSTLFTVSRVLKEIYGIDIKAFELRDLCTIDVKLRMAKAAHQHDHLWWTVIKNCPPAAHAAIDPDISIALIKFGEELRRWRTDESEATKNADQD